ncbi:MAG TPA: tautomerase family protein [Brevibacillus sp.]|nr:tautomerase family protein [Brevibacillus sp.]
MPYITVKMMEGRSLETKAHLVREMTDAAARSLGIDATHIRIELVELKEGTFSVAGVLAKAVSQQASDREG